MSMSMFPVSAELAQAIMAGRASGAHTSIAPDQVMIMNDMPRHPSPVVPMGQPMANHLLRPVIMASAGLGMPMLSPVGQLPQGAFVFAPHSNSFLDSASMQASFVNVKECQQSSEGGASDRNRFNKKDSEAPVYRRRPNQERLAPESSDALTSEEIEQLRLAVQNTVRKLQNPNSFECFGSYHSKGTNHLSKLNESDSDAASSTSSTCAPESRLACSDDSVDGDAKCEIFRGGVKPIDQHSFSDTYIDHMLSELECSNSGRRQVALEWVIHSTRILAFTRRGCRIVQQAMELAVAEDQERLVEKLEGLVLEAAQSPHANYVLQKCFEIMPAHKLRFVMRELQGQGAAVARHRCGCRVIQRALEHCPPEQIEDLIAEVLAHTPQLVRHAYGNFVIQHILQHGTSYQVHHIVDVLRMDALRLANHRIASHVISCALSCRSPDDVQSLVEILRREQDQLAERQYGSFVAREVNRVGSRLRNVATN
jgi:hypothetical protein